MTFSYLKLVVLLFPEKRGSLLNIPHILNICGYSFLCCYRQETRIPSKCIFFYFCSDCTWESFVKKGKAIQVYSSGLHILSNTLRTGTTSSESDVYRIKVKDKILWLSYCFLTNTSNLYIEVVYYAQNVFLSSFHAVSDFSVALQYVFRLL